MFNKTFVTSAATATATATAIAIVIDCYRFDASHKFYFSLKIGNKLKAEKVHTIKLSTNNSARF